MAFNLEFWDRYDKYCFYQRSKAIRSGFYQSRDRANRHFFQKNYTKVCVSQKKAVPLHPICAESLAI